MADKRNPAVACGRIENVEKVGTLNVQLAYDVLAKLLSSQLRCDIQARVMGEKEVRM